MPPRVILGSNVGTAPADGATIGRRILINRPDDGNARCKVSRALVQHKDFSPFTQQPTTPSTFNAISFQQGRTELFEARPWTHGVRPLLQHKQDRQRDHSRLSFDNVTKPATPMAETRSNARGRRSAEILIRIISMGAAQPVAIRNLRHRSTECHGSSAQWRRWLAPLQLKHARTTLHCNAGRHF